MNLRQPNRLRVFAFIFGVVLSLQAVWLLAAEITRPALPFFPMNEADVKAAAARASAAATAARIGWPRGNLWVNYAMAADADVIGNIESGLPQNSRRVSDDLRSITERAVALAPYDSRAWLMLAAINSQSASQASETLAQIKMSYYTSPNDVRLMPFRIQIATRSSLIADDELQSFVENELCTIVQRSPDLKHSIALAYRGASPAGRRFLDSKLADLDAGFLAELHNTRP